VKGTIRRYFLSILFFTALHCSSQTDSLIYYYSHSSPANLSSAQRLLKKYTDADSLELKNIGLKLPRKEDKVAYYNAVGERFYSEDNYRPARYYFSRALEFARLTLNKKLIADQLQSLGDLYRLQDQNTTALNLLLQAMYLYKELGQEKELGHTMSLIGDLNRCIDQYSDALKYLGDALAITHKTNDIKEQAFCYSSLGGTYQALKEYGRSFDAYSKGLVIARKINDTMRIIDFNYSIGDLMTDRGKIPEAISYLEEGVRLCNIYGDKYYLGFCRMGLSRAYLRKKNYDRSLEEGLKAYKVGEELNAYGFCSEASEVIFEAYAGKNDFKNAYRYLKIVKDNNDSTMSSSKIKQQAQIEINFRNSYQEKQDSLLRFTQEKQKDLEHESELKQQKMLAFAGIAGLLVALVVALVVYRSYKKVKRSREIINQQKAIVDTKNKEILDSINYARKIQQAIIPTDSEVKNIFPESFIILLPKDIVSGDFYWITEKEQYVFFAVADCTGHGVPGGFMSMLGTALLNEIINDKSIYEPADILDMLKLKIILALRQSDNMSENKDGMDIALIRYDKRSRKLKFSGANNSLYMIHNDELRELKGDKHPIGFSFNNTSRQFSQAELDVEEGDAFYMFTDGYPDQFGGPQGKKFKYKPLEQALLEIHREPLKEQGEQLFTLHHEWKGRLEQVDDILIAGFRL
jgi:serine phosphatase RsbU (regulator of sigma subunit)